MTVATLVSSDSWVSAGTLAPRSIPFPFINLDDLVATYTPVTGAVQNLVRGTHYIITGDNRAGTAVFAPLVVFAAGGTFRTRRVTRPLQEYETERSTPLDADSVERELDRVAMRNLEQDRDAAALSARTPKVPEGETAPQFDSLAGLQDGDMLTFEGGKLKRFDVSPFAGKFVAGGAGGRLLPSDGLGGGDLALRGDLAGTSGAAFIGTELGPLSGLSGNFGFALIRHKRSETGTFARTARQLALINAMDGSGVSIMHWVDPDLDDAILNRIQPTLENELPWGHSEFLQKALDYAPLNSVLTMPVGTLRVDQELLMARAMSFEVPQGGYIFGVFDDPEQFMLNIRLESAFGNEGRGLMFKSLRLEHAFGFDCAGAINMEAQEGVHLPQHQFHHIACYYAVPNLSSGRAVRIAGVASQQHYFDNCEIFNAVHLDKCADANLFHKCWFLGKKANLIDMAPGAFQTIFEGGTGVALDGYARVVNGSQVFFKNIQMEHPSSNTAEYSATIVIAPEDYDSVAIRIYDCNFGGGPVDHSIYATSAKGAKVRNLKIGNNIFGITQQKDIVLADSGVEYTDIAEGQDYRWERGGATFTTYPTMSANTLDVNGLGRFTDNGKGTSGVRLPASRLGGDLFTALINGWTCPASFYATKDKDGWVKFNGYVVAPGAGTDVQFLQMPEGFRPDDTQLFTIGNVSGAVLTNGAIVATASGAGNVGISNFTYRAKREGYQPGY